MSAETTTKERPILFSGPMVRAILEGRKTQTRRVITPQPAAGVRWGFQGWEDGHGRALRCPYGAPGDRLWVRETIRATHPTEAYYVVDGQRVEQRGWRFEWRDVKDKWASGARAIPSIHMPRWASRITLEVTGVRVERVQNISEADARAEGVEGLLLRQRPDLHYEHVPLTFQHLWDEINGPRGFGWESNPWVWVVEFKPIDAR